MTFICQIICIFSDKYIYLQRYGLFFRLLDNGNDLNFQNIVNVVGWWLHLIFWCLHLIFWWLHLIFPKLQSCCQKLPLYKNSYSQIHHQGISSCKLLLLLLLRGWCSWYFFSPSPKSPVGTSWTRYWAVKHGKVSSSHSLLLFFLKNNQFNRENLTNETKICLGWFFTQICPHEKAFWLKIFTILYHA